MRIILRDIVILFAIVIVGLLVSLGIASFFTPYTTPAGKTYEMPAQCHGDLSEITAGTYIYNMPRATLEAWNRFLKIAPKGWRLHGTTVSLPGLQPFIVIDETLDPKEYTLTLHHERCHIIAGAWHG